MSWRGLGKPGGAANVRIPPAPQNVTPEGPGPCSRTFHGLLGHNTAGPTSSVWLSRTPSRRKATAYHGHLLRVARCSQLRASGISPSRSLLLRCVPHTPTTLLGPRISLVLARASAYSGEDKRRDSEGAQSGRGER